MHLSVSQLLLTPWMMGVMTTAVKLRVFSILSHGEMTAKEIADEAGSITERLEPLLEACACMSLLNKNNDKYENTYFSAIYFVEGRKHYVGDFLELMHYESLQWFRLAKIIKGETNEKINIPYFEYNHKTFITAMNCLGHLGEAEAMCDFADLSGCRKMVDAGGGSGLYSIALCRRYPKLQSTIFDLKETIEVTQEFISKNAVKDRITLQKGDFLKDDFGTELDAVLMSDMVYGELEAEKVLKNAWNSLKPKGKLIVRGYYSDVDKTKSLFGSLFRVKQLLDNWERPILNLAGLEKIVEKTGFTIKQISPLTEFSFALLGEK